MDQEDQVVALDLQDKVDLLVQVDQEVLLVQVVEVDKVGLLVQVDIMV